MKEKSCIHLYFVTPVSPRSPLNSTLSLSPLLVNSLITNISTLDMETELDFCCLKSEDSGNEEEEDEILEWPASPVTGQSTSFSKQMVIYNDRLMSETVQSEHSYFHSAMGEEDSCSRDGDISHSSTFKGESGSILSPVRLHSWVQRRPL